jgi:uncharacterized membrane protein YphA (DoxX/SURF4 family)
LAYRGCRRKSRHGSATEPFLPPLLALGLVTRFAALSLSAFNIVAVILFWHVLGGSAKPRRGGRNSCLTIPAQ